MTGLWKISGRVLSDEFFQTGDGGQQTGAADRWSLDRPKVFELSEGSEQARMENVE